MKTRDTKDEAAKAARDALIAMHEGIAIGIMQQVESMEEPGKCPPGLLLQMGAASQSAAALRSAEALEGIEAMLGMMATTSMLGGIGSLGATVDRFLSGLDNRTSGEPKETWPQVERIRDAIKDEDKDGAK